MFNITTVFDQMVPIPHGDIVLRDDRIKQEWQVEINPFLCAQYPVTQELYFSITHKRPSAHTGENLPVENISWYDAITFCNHLSQKTGLEPCYIENSEDKTINYSIAANGFRLLSEAEWEYACRTGTTKIRYGELDAIAWYKNNSLGKTHEVGTKEPNAWGLYDMLGNVWEWCWDIYDDAVYGSYRIFRGGGWNDPERGCMASNRRRSHPTFQIDDLGFRIARSIK